MNNPADITLIYRTDAGELLEQPLSDITESGVLIDSETGADLELFSWRPTASAASISAAAPTVCACSCASPAPQPS